ncbi:MAG: CRISPR-associated endoribonuclease Cas6 [Synergistaceae bacterium]|nr:CRISPR-associated endoribonuclease Cas6 [Synergistaceae bacterium]
MHIILWLTSPDNNESSIRLPSANLHLFQSMLYALLPPDDAKALHDDGFDSDGRKMKLFAMSWPCSESRPQFGEGVVLFPLPVKLTVTTPLTKLIAGFTGGALSKRTLRVGNNYLECARVETESQIADSEQMTIKTLSPVTCYDSIENEGRKFTKYFAPDDKEFQRGIYFNLVRKFRLLNPDYNCEDFYFRITPAGRLKERISMFERDSLFPVIGWWGKFRLEGSKELLQTALDCGLGSKNSAGFGCITKINKSERR